MKLIVSANIGLGKAENNAANQQKRTKTYARLHDALANVYNKSNYKMPDCLALQECGENADFSPAPLFERPIATDIELLKQDDSKARGVSIFTRKNFTGQIIPNTDWEDEIVAITDSYSQKGVKKEFGLKIFRQKYSIRNYIILGDFNTESSFNFGAGISEIFHSELYHKHNKNTKKTRIDRVFTNIPSVKISLVLPSIEAINKGDQESNKLGHKVYAVQIGETRTKTKGDKEDASSFVSLKKLGKKVKSTNPILADIDFDAVQQLDKMTKIDTMNFMAENMNQEALKFIEDCKIKRKGPGKKKNAILMSEVEKVEEQVLCGKKPDKALIRLVDACKNGLESVADSDGECSLLDKSSKLTKKLKELNPADIEKGKAIAERLYKNTKNTKCLWVKGLKEFRKIVCSTSNSGALDFMGLSLKMTKLLLKNKCFLKRYREICTIALENGSFPTAWKNDEISFLYKNKGSRMDGSNYRPITIAPSFGKHLERLISYMISPMDDLNRDNHACRKSSSCLTAIVDLQRKITYAKLMATDKDLKKFKAITMLSFDDIAGAFESIDHILVCYALELIFQSEERVDIAGIMMSYLDRKSKLIDRSSGESLELIKVHLLKTSPQGSILSPLLWRIYDNIFTELYKDSIKVVEEENDDIISISHLSYADDHVTIITFWVEVDDDIQSTGERMSQILCMTRETLAKATKQLGCAINPLKSENVVPKKYKDSINLDMFEEHKDQDPKIFKGKSIVKWLGFYLELTENHQIMFNEEEIKKRCNSVMHLRDQIFQYTSTISIKWRIYKMYIAPYTELYTPLVAQNLSGTGSKTSCIHDLQHRSICKAINVCQTTSRRELEVKHGEKSVEEKTQRMAIRIIEAMNLKPIGCDARINREGQATLLFPANKNERNNLINRFFLYRNLTIPETKKVKFRTKNIQIWLNKVRRKQKFYKIAYDEAKTRK